MQAPGIGELIFVIVMLLLTVAITAGCLYLFMRQYRKEMKEKQKKDRE